MPSGFPVVIRGDVRHDVTGLVGKSGSIILNEDSFANGYPGWTQLFTPDGTMGTMWGTVSIVDRGTPRLLLRTHDQALINVANPSGNNTGGKKYSGGMAIKRMSNMLGDGQYLVEMLATIDQAISQTDRPSRLQWGLDTADKNGLRRFFQLSFFNYDETGATQVKKLQVKTGYGSSDANYADLPGGQISLTDITNENKALPVYIALLVNTATGCYEGIRIDNRLKLGRLADTPDDSLINLGQVGSAMLAPFANGMNPCFDILPRSAAAKTAGSMGLIWQRTTKLGGQS